ncbi:DUF4145 domain-containing protein [Sphingobium yanoikuyae]|uniref:DUF4145 domain-containing protein n=1 Tax=Sphingobium yanoikuyae TaxID=13690 RepID=A0A291MU83_SPHYA|nr:DUF4145 domain-containing protein [Sphingobium yanoikuyae]ATI78683.1 DUF4145 domain-containing protein [Sphingobium yanoikuyae]
MNKISKRYLELLDQLSAVLATKRRQDGHYSMAGDYVDAEMFNNWKVKARHLLALSCGEQSSHYRGFTEFENGSGWGTNHSMLLNLKAVFEAAHEDFEGGYLSSVRSLVQAEIFSNELDQATELLGKGYKVAAAVVAGVVLETSLRQLCEDGGITPSSLNKMNADLVKAEVYSLLVSKRITALADIRNNAAHGHSDEFTHDDVRDMIEKTGSFVADHIR